MLDTNVMDRVADGVIALESFRGLALFVTHVQLDEIRAIPDQKRRAVLLEVFSEVAPEMVPTSTGVFGDSYWGLAEYSNGHAYEDILARIQALDVKAGKRLRGFNQSRDARILETALYRGFVLVTDDHDLATVMCERGGEAISPSDLRT